MTRTFWLLLSPRVAREGLPSLAHSGGLGVAHLRWIDLDDGTELIANVLQSLPANRQGRDFGSLDDLLLVRLANIINAGSAERLLAGFTPSARQRVVALVLGQGHSAGRWNGAVQEDGQTHPLAGFTVIGPGMIRVSAAPSLPLTNEAQQRWSRTRGALGDEIWRRVRDSQVAVVGAGRNGSAAVLGLALLGARRLVLIDGDRDEAHNLDATVGCSPGGVGRPKVLNRQQALLEIRPNDLEVVAVARSLPHPEAIDALRGADLLVTCVDHDTARLAVARLANRWARPHLDIGTGVFRDGGQVRMGGDVRLLLPGEACVVCLGGLRNMAEAEYDLRAPPGALRRGAAPIWSEQRAGSLLTLNQMVVHSGIQLWLDLLAGQLRGSVWLGLEWLPEAGLVTTRTWPTLNPCPLCRPLAAATTPRPT